MNEAGAIEYTGHKVLEIGGTDGKLSATDIEAFVSTFYADENHEHTVVRFATSWSTRESDLSALGELL